MEEIILLAVIMVLGMGAYWMMVLVPKQRDFHKRQKFVRSLVAGEEVITAGGVIGKVVDVRSEEGVAYVEIAEGIIVRVLAASVLSPYDPEELARNVRMGFENETAQQE